MVEELISLFIGYSSLSVIWVGTVVWSWVKSGISAVCWISVNCIDQSLVSDKCFGHGKVLSIDGL